MGVIIINQSSDIQLYFLCVVQTHPPIASALIGFIGFQQPPLGCAFSVCLFQNCESTDTCIFPGLAVVSTRFFPDIQIGNGYPHQIRFECCLGVHRFSGFIKHTVSRISICTFLCILQKLKRAFLRGCICPCFADSVSLCCSRRIRVFHRNSRFRVYRISLSKTQDILFSFLDDAFETFGGVRMK